MSAHGHIKATDLQARLTHPVIDADGHWLDTPVVLQELQRLGGNLAVEGFTMFRKQVQQALNMSVAERQRQRLA